MTGIPPLNGTILVIPRKRMKPCKRFYYVVIFPLSIFSFVITSYVQLYRLDKLIQTIFRLFLYNLIIIIRIKK